MSNRLSRFLFTAVLVLGVASWSAQAAPLGTSQISFDGSATLNGSLGTATYYTQIAGPSGAGGPIVSGASGSYSGALGAVASFTAFPFNPAPLSVFQLWAFTVGETTYRFDATSMVVQSQTPTLLSIQGTGVASITGFDATPGTFSITSFGASGSPPLGFTATVSIVPEPHASWILLLGSIGLLVRRSSRAAV